jgi:hypothetical protein
MKVNRIQCDRCGREEDAASGNVTQTVIKLHREGMPPAIDKTPDLCETCFDLVQAGVFAALAKD